MALVAGAAFIERWGCSNKSAAVWALPCLERRAAVGTCAATAGVIHSTFEAIGHFFSAKKQGCERKQAKNKPNRQK